MNDSKELPGTPFYVVSRRYVGPNRLQDGYIDADTVGIYESPAIGNMSGEPVIEGWCGTTNDWSTYGCGAYPSIEKALEAIKLRFGVCREQELPEYDDNVIKLYKPGQFERLSAQATGDWASTHILADITADISDEDINALMEEYEGDARSHGCSLELDILQEAMADRRAELIGEQFTQNKEKAMEAKNLEELLDLLRKMEARGEIERIDLADLPTFGGEAPTDTYRIWSWDENRLLVGTQVGDGKAAGDMSIVTRDAYQGTLSDEP